jgi:hypothetical protein
LVQTTTPNGDNRELVKQIGDSDTLLKLLQEDLLAKDDIIAKRTTPLLNALRKLIHHRLREAIDHPGS